MWWLILLFSVLVGAFLFFASFFIRAGIYIKALCKKNTYEKIVALTFDDGPDSEFTPRVLDLLKQYKVNATFFCIGKKAEENPAIIKRISDEGHLIGNHSYSHTVTFPFFSYNKMLTDVKKSQDILENITKRKINFFRPPFGVTNPTIAKVVRTLGYVTIGWNIRSFDTRGEIPEKIYKRIIKQVKPGSIILLHDRNQIQRNLPVTNSKELLVMLLDYLIRENYKIVRIDELFDL